MYPKQDAEKAALGEVGDPNSAPCLHLLVTSQRAPSTRLGTRKLRPCPPLLGSRQALPPSPVEGHSVAAHRPRSRSQGAGRRGFRMRREEGLDARRMCEGSWEGGDRGCECPQSPEKLEGGALRILDRKIHNLSVFPAPSPPHPLHNSA